MGKTHWKKEFNYNYLGSYSLPDGKDIILTIKEMKKETVAGFDGKKDDCLIAYFVESVKPMIVNKTNCKTITKVLGTPFIEEWQGKKIQIGTTNIKAFGELTDTLRVRNFTPKESRLEKVVTGSEAWKQIVNAINSGYSIEQIQTKYLLTKQQIELLCSK